MQVDAGATLAFNRRDHVSFSSLISGEGRFIKQGTGNLTLNQGLSLKQGVEIQSGSLILQAGASLTGPLHLGHQVELYLEEGATLRLRDGISGSGTITHLGSLLSLSGSVTADYLFAQYGGMTEVPAQVVLGEAGRSTTVNIRNISMEQGGRLDVVGPATQVLGKSETDRRPSELTLTGGQMAVRDGAQVSRDRASVSAGGQLRVQGAGSLLEVRGAWDQGNTFQLKSKATVELADGGRLVTDFLWLDGTDVQLTVQGPGSSLQASYLRSSQNSQIQVLSGALLESGETGTPRLALPTLDAKMLVSGAGDIKLTKDGNV
ncbi:MAG: hypothetical protein ACOVOG_14710, partial [Rubrivivax sp.]